MLNNWRFPADENLGKMEWESDGFGMKEREI